MLASLPLLSHQRLYHLPASTQEEWGADPQHAQDSAPAPHLHRAFQPFLLQLPLVVLPQVSGRALPDEAGHLAGTFTLDVTFRDSVLCSSMPMVLLNVVTIDHNRQ